MAARRSLQRSIRKFMVSAPNPVAMVTAFRGDRRLEDNRERNVQLEADLQQLGLGYYPVYGVGQEEKKRLLGMIRWIVPSREESFVVQPRSEMPDETFEEVIRNLMQKYGQYGAMVKLPSTAQPFILLPTGERDYQGSKIGPRTARDSYYSQLKCGPRADESMLNPWEFRIERNPIKRIINWWSGRSAMNQPADRSKVGRRFTICWEDG